MEKCMPVKCGVILSKLINVSVLQMLKQKVLQINLLLINYKSAALFRYVFDQELLGNIQDEYNWPEICTGS